MDGVSFPPSDGGGMHIDRPGDVKVQISAQAGAMMADIVESKLLQVADSVAFVQLLSSLRVTLENGPVYAEDELRFRVSRDDDGGPPDEADLEHLTRAFREFFTMQLPGAVKVTLEEDSEEPQ